ncbi:Fc.00g059880.m01.CDS01 [Cosmosporella sp. VM-42]
MEGFDWVYLNISFLDADGSLPQEISGQTAKLWRNGDYDKSKKELEMLQQAREQLSNERIRDVGFARHMLEVQTRVITLDAEQSAILQIQVEIPELLLSSNSLYGKSGALVELMLQLKNTKVQLSR